MMKLDKKSPFLRVMKFGATLILIGKKGRDPYIYSLMKPETTIYIYTYFF